MEWRGARGGDPASAPDVERSSGEDPRQEAAPGADLARQARPHVLELAAGLARDRDSQPEISELEDGAGGEQVQIAVQHQVRSQIGIGKPELPDRAAGDQQDLPGARRIGVAIADQAGPSAPRHLGHRLHGSAGPGLQVQRTDLEHDNGSAAGP
jgi:hypothetical protein